jgi:hypothetical protein
MRHDITTRRRFIASGLLASAVMPLGMTAGAAAPKPNVSRAGSWVLGDKLSLAAIGYGRGMKQDVVDRFLDQAKSIAGDLGVTVNPLPPKANASAETLATVIHYLIKGEGWSTGKQIVDKYDRTHGVLFEVAVKSNLLLLLYEPGNDSGLGALIKSRCEEIKLPPHLWMDLVTKMGNKVAADAVREAVFKMQKDVPRHLLDS